MWMDRQKPEGKGLDGDLNSRVWRDAAAARDMFQGRDLQSSGEPEKAHTALLRVPGMGELPLPPQGAAGS